MDESRYEELADALVGAVSTREQSGYEDLKRQCGIGEQPRPESADGAPPHELSELFEAVRSATSGDLADKTQPPPFRPTNLADLAGARLHPRCIVEKLLYADLAVVNAEGGTGKTTLLLYETVHIALGRDLWGCRVLNPGRTLFITAEDGEELLQARLREVMSALNLTEWERRTVCENFMIWDVTGSLVRLAELDARGNLKLTELADSVVETYRDVGLAQVVFDPAISFSPGERIVNDGEQAVVTACRRIVRGLNCCVRLIHHSGQANARNGAIDQYAGRGGTALPDGCRMVTILANAERATIAKPDGWTLQPGESGFVMVRAKLSYTGPQPNIWIRRNGWTFEWTIEVKQSAEERASVDARTVADFLSSELLHSRRYTRKMLEDSDKLKLSRARLRAAIAELEIAGQLKEQELPAELKQGGRKTYLHLAAKSGEVAAQSAPEGDTTSPPSTTSPPYREYKSGEVAAALYPHDSLNLAAKSGEVAARLARLNDQTPEPPPTNPQPDKDAATLEAEGRRLLEAAKTAPSGVKVLPSGEYAVDLAPGSRVDLRNRGNRLLEQARKMRLAEDGKRESPPTHAAPPICRPAEGYPFRLIVKCDKPMPIYGPDGGDPVGCESCGARWGARP